MLRLAVGHSFDIDLDRAISEVVSQAKADLAQDRAGAGLLLVSGGLDHEQVLPAIRDAFPDVPLIGCTTAGEASSRLGFQDDSLLLVLFISGNLQFATAVGRKSSQDPGRAAAEAHAQLDDQLDGKAPALCFMLSDALLTDPDLVLAALREGFGASVPIVGGGAAHYPPGEATTYLFIQDEILTEAFVLLALAGDLNIATAIETSWCPIGKAGRVTSVDGQLVRRIDDKPALAFYRDHLGPDASFFLGTPLAILESDGGLRLRAPFVLEGETEAIGVSGSLSEGDRIQLTFATVDDVQDGAGKVIERGLASFSGARSPAFVFFCSCAARRMFLALDVESEFDQLRAAVGPDVPIVGFYGFGEIGSDAVMAPSRFHNQTIVLAAVG